MWKNKIHSKRIGLYSRYQVEGRNIHALINILNKQKIEIRKLKIISKNAVIISIPFFDNKKFFAILNELCYNIKKIKDYGFGYPLLFFYRNIGLTLGAVFFIVLSIISNGYIFAISFTGSGNVYEGEIKEQLYRDGIKPFCSFSSFDLKKEASVILKENKNLSFVSLERKGNYLIVNSAVKEEKKEIKEQKPFLKSTCNGVIENLKVYRGVAKKNIGDSVCVGDMIVEPKEYMSSYGNVIACASIICDYKFSFENESDALENDALVLAKELLDREIVEEKTEKTKVGNRYIYSVTLKYRVIIS